MSKSDSKLGMGAEITRRDLIHDSALAALGLSLPLATAPVLGNSENRYPPTATGLRGSHPGSFEAAHALVREGKGFPVGRKIDESFDLIIVGAGISGLAAAHYYRERFGADARILLLENHDDFGGHARRNEFHQSGQMRLSLGGTHNLEHWKFSDTVKAHMQALGIDTDKMRTHMQFDYGLNSPSGEAWWFDRETYGRSVLLPGCNLRSSGPKNVESVISELPLSEDARMQLLRLYTADTNLLQGSSETEANAYLHGTRYTDFLREEVGLGDEAVQVFANASHGSWAVELRNFSVMEALNERMPGRNWFDMEPDPDKRIYPVAMFPDGNASVARLQLAALIPNAAPGMTADNVAVMPLDYSELDRFDSPVRLRLSSTVVGARNTDSGVAVSYLNEGEVLQVTARHCVMACYHAIIPHLCPQLPPVQQAAMNYQVKRPLLLTNVLLRSSDAMDKLGIDAVNCPGRLHARLFMFKGINTGGYRHDYADTGAVPLVFWGTISPPEEIDDIKDQHRASRQKMLELTFADYEREVRIVLDELLGPAGFDVETDILAITVNRWPHGYSYDYMDLWDPEWPPGQAPHEIARQLFGNIAMANSDAGADAYTHVAIDEAHRAVFELSG